MARSGRKASAIPIRSYWVNLRKLRTICPGKSWQRIDSRDFLVGRLQFMDSDFLKNLIARLFRGKKERERFIESHLAKGIGHQLRTLRDREKLSQTELAKEVSMTQNAISRLESA